VSLPCTVESIASNRVAQIEVKYQGTTVEKSLAQKLNQGARKNVLNIIFS